MMACSLSLIRWDLNEASAKCQALRVEARLIENVNPHVIRIATTAFCESVGQEQEILESTPLSQRWKFPRFRGKGLPIPWIQQIIQLQKDAVNNCIDTQVNCISHIPLEKWRALSSVEIKNALPPKLGPLKRFKAAKQRLTRFKDALERYKQSQILESDFRTHVVAPCWTSTEACASCAKLLNFSVEPRNLTRRCLRMRDFPVQVLCRYLVAAI